MNLAPVIQDWLRGPAGHWVRIFALGAAVGVLSGLAAGLIELGLRFGPDLIIERFVSTEGGTVLVFRPAVLILPAVGGLLSGLVIYWLCRDEREHGTNQYILAFHQHGGQLELRSPAVKAASAVGVISCGGSAGPEGPIAALGAAIGSSVARGLKLSPSMRRKLLVAGCAGGVGAVFQCPLGGALFATSVLYWEPEFEAESIVPGFVSSVISYSTFAALFAQHRMIHGAELLQFAAPIELLPYAVLGLLCGVVGIFYRLCVVGVERAVPRRLRVPVWIWPAVGGLLVGLIGCGLPQVLGGRYDFIQNALDGRLLAADTAGVDAWHWAVLFGLVTIAKCLATALTVGSGAAGGMLGPSVFIGGCVGAFVAALLQAALPGVFDPALSRSLIAVGMAGVLSAAMRTPLAAMVIVTEMTGGYGLIVPLMLVCVMSYVVCRRWGLNVAQIRSASQSPAHAADALVHMLEGVNVGDVMDGSWRYVASPAAGLGDLLAPAPSGTHPVFAVVEEGRLIGTISLGEIGRAVADPALAHIVTARDMLTQRVPVLLAGENLYDCLPRFGQAAGDVLPVVASRRSMRFLGMLSRRTVHELVRDRLESRRAAVQREHAGLSVIEQDESLHQLMVGMAAPNTDTIQRISVPPEAVGRTLRDVDFRRTYHAQVLAIQGVDGALQCPPDPDRRLEPGQTLLVLAQ